MRRHLNIHMRLYEIDYASGIPTLNFTQAELDGASQVGTVDQQPVFLIDDGINVFTFLKDQHKLASYVVISSNEHNGYHDLSRMANMRGPKGSITALLVFLYAKFGIKFRIPAHEPLTWDGFKWIRNRIRNPRGFHIHDQEGEPMDLTQLEAEWNLARLTDVVGATEILISKITYNKQTMETWQGRLQPAYRYMHDEFDV
jgi:hypothetical protein